MSSGKVTHLMKPEAASTWGDAVGREAGKVCCSQNTEDPSASLKHLGLEAYRYCILRNDYHEKVKWWHYPFKNGIAFPRSGVQHSEGGSV